MWTPAISNITKNNVPSIKNKVEIQYWSLRNETILVINNENSLVWFSKQKQEIPGIFQAIFKLQVFQVSMHPDRTTEHVLLHCPHSQNTHDIHSL